MTVEWRDGNVRFLDQTRLPFEEAYVETQDYRLIAEAIRALRIRGAPAIGVAAAFGLVLAAAHAGENSLARVRVAVAEARDVLARTRPTAVNLFAAIDRMHRVLEDSSIQSVEQLRAALFREAGRIQEEDREACDRIGEFGATLIPSGCSVLTHCNAGALATSGIGTAVGVIITAARQGKIRSVYVDETRPLLQGARLTTWELLREGIPAFLITDSTAGSVIQQGKVQCVLVGADRIAANGDAANKIGTYPLAVLSHRHGVPFYVAAPVTTIDPGVTSGRAIPIEERADAEVTHLAGIRIAPEGVGVYAPAFDVTPNELINAIVTEYGIARPPFTESLAAILKKASLAMEMHP